MSDLRLNGLDFRKLAQEILTAGHRVRFQATGASMHPFIQDGDILEVVPLAEKLKIKCGDVLLVDTDVERLLAHRVVKINRHQGVTRYLIKSDASCPPDGWFRLENILGRVDVVERGNRRILLTSVTQRWKARTWVIIAPWASKISWLPGRVRQRVRDWLLVS